jgi:tetratricopeptide (TPR) repeat protein
MARKNPRAKRNVSPAPARTFQLPALDPRWWWAALAALAVVVYWPALSGGFIWDDDTLLTLNPLVKASDGLYRIWFTGDAIDYWPVTNTSFWLEWRIWGTHAAGYHATNLVLHLASTFLFWTILRALSVPGAWLAASLFLLHPVNVESVAWIAERKNTLSMFFALLSTLWFIREPNPEGRGPNWYALSVAAFVLAMLSKGSVAPLPAMLLVIIWWQRGTITRADLVKTAPFFGVSIALTLVNIWFQTHQLTTPIREAAPLERLLGAGAVVWFYLYKALLPLKLIFVYPEWDIRAGDVRWWLPLAGAIAVSAILIWQRRRPVARALLCGWLLFGLALVPVMGFVDVYFMKYSLVADHYQYLAILSVTACVAAGLARLPANARLAAGAVLLAALSFGTWKQSHLYASAETLYRTTLRDNPSAWLAHNNLAAILTISNPDEALFHANEAARLKPSDPVVHNDRGTLLLRAGRMDMANAEFREAIRLMPTFAAAHNNLCNSLDIQQRYEDAAAACREALRLAPNMADAHYNLGIALLGLGQTNAAEEFSAVLALRPEMAEAHYYLAGLLQMRGQLSDAQRHFEEAIRLKPDLADAQYGLGRLLQTMGRDAEAIERYETTLRMEPSSSAAHNSLGVVLLKTGRLDEAVKHFEEAVRLLPSFGQARANLIIARERRAKK